MLGELEGEMNVVVGRLDDAHAEMGRGEYGVVGKALCLDGCF